MDEVKVGSLVRLPACMGEDSYSGGTVREIDRKFWSARVRLLSTGAERWVALDELEVVEQREPRRRSPYGDVGAEK